MSHGIKKRYTREFRESSAQLAMDSDQPMSQIAQELGVNQVTLASWVAKYASKTQKSAHTQKSAEEELRELRKEVARLKQERDILKKAAAFFANETH